jgi:hypothetical protein
MRTFHVRLGEECETSDALARFAKECERLDPADRQHAVREVHTVVSGLDRSGHELASLGSQFLTNKMVEFPFCKVKITARYGAPRCGRLSKWIRSLFRSR